MISSKVKQQLTLCPYLMYADPFELQPNVKPGEKRLRLGCKEFAPLMPLPSEPKRILVVLKGISYDRKYKQGMYNYTRTYHNFNSHIVDAWRSQGHTVNVGISTFPTDRQQHMQQVYAPLFFVTSMQGYRAVGRTKIHSLLDALQAAVSYGGASRWDFIVITRFDITMKMPMTDVSVDFEKINFPWRQ
eukprot:scaffold167663_cov37-Prasinocladus_malaysianus.AAC.1